MDPHNFSQPGMVDRIIGFPNVYPGHAKVSLSPVAVKSHHSVYQ